MISFYYRSCNDSSDQFYRSYKIGLEVGSLYTCSISASSYILFGLTTGIKLPKLVKRCNEFNEVLPLKGLMYSAMCQAVFNLTNVQNYSSLSGEEFDFNCCFDNSKKPYDVARALIICCIYAYLFNDYTSASKFLNSYRPLSGYISVLSGFIDPILIFYDCLISLAATKTDDKDTMLIEQVNVNIMKLRNLSVNAPMNYLNKVHFLEAELSGAHGDVQNAIKNYKEAISLSNKYGFCNEEAMACERAGMFYLKLGTSHASSASQLLLKAYRCYDDWGAKAKLHQLNKRYPVIFADKITTIEFTGIRVKQDESSVSIMSLSETSSNSGGGETSKRKRRKS